MGLEHTWETFLWRVCEFSFDFGWISEKVDEFNKSRQFRGPMPRRKDPTPRRRVPTQQCKSTPQRDLEGGLDKPRVCRGVAMPRQRTTPQRSTVHRHVFLSCFAIPLFQGLVYWTNEDLISV